MDHASDEWLVFVFRSYFRQDAHVTPVAQLSRFASSDFLFYSMASWMGSFLTSFSLGFFVVHVCLVLPHCHGVCCAGGFPALPRSGGLISGVVLRRFREFVIFSPATMVFPCSSSLFLLFASCWSMSGGWGDRNWTSGWQDRSSKGSGKHRQQWSDAKGRGQQWSSGKGWSHGQNQSWSTGSHPQSWRAPPMIGDGKGRPGWIATAAAGAVESVLTSTVKETFADAARGWISSTVCDWVKKCTGFKTQPCLSGQSAQGADPPCVFFFFFGSCTRGYNTVTC